MRISRSKFRFQAFLLGFAVLVLMTGMLPEVGIAAQTIPTPTPAVRVQENQTTEPDVVITVSESYLNRLVAEAVSDRTDLQNLVVDLKEESSADVAVSMPFLRNVNVRTRARLALAIESGKLQASIVSFDFGNVPVPRSLVNRRLTTLENELNIAINRQLVSQLQLAGLQLTEVKTNETQMLFEMQAVDSVELP